MIIIASFIAAPSEGAHFNLLLEINKNLFNLVDIMGIYVALKYKYTLLDNQLVRVLAVAIGKRVIFRI